MLINNKHKTKYNKSIKKLLRYFLCYFFLSLSRIIFNLHSYESSFVYEKQKIKS